ncbi:MAG: hypothetical protein ACTSXZ_06060, partial [Alphaproteobacteria bacterium]
DYEGTYDSYKRVLDNWTRSGKIYDNFATHLSVSATYFSRPMRRVFVAEWARAFDLPEAERQMLLQDHLEQAERQVEFVVSFYTPEMRYNDLDHPESSWRVWFIDAAGTRVGAARIERVRVKHRKEFYFYPTYTEFGRLYRVVFPAVNEGGQPLAREQGKITLRITGVQGSVDLVWDIPPDAH